MHFESEVVRNVAAFDVYLTAILRRVFTEVPNVLKSSQSTLTYEQILEFKNRDEFILWAAEKEVMTLSFKGLAALVAHFKQKKWVTINLETPVGKAANEFIEVRNIIVHNSGRISKLFLRRTLRTDLEEGDEFPLSREYITNGSLALRDLAHTMDQAILTHFKLPFDPPK